MSFAAFSDAASLLAQNVAVYTLATAMSRPQPASFAILALAPAVLLLATTARPQTGSVTEEPMPFRRLPPSSFKELPPKVRDKLTELGCTIPQMDYLGHASNVVRASFAKPGQMDWAVLCSKRFTSNTTKWQRGKGTFTLTTHPWRSRVLVFWGGPAACKNDLPWVEDDVFLQGDGTGVQRYSRMVGTVTHRALERYPQPPPPPMDHPALEDAFAGKASRVYYCSHGKWEIIGGAD